MRLQVFIFSSYVGDAWTVLRGVQIVMTDDQCTRIAAMKVFQELTQCCFLLWCPRVGGLTADVEATAELPVVILPVPRIYLSCGTLLVRPHRTAMNDDECNGSHNLLPFTTLYEDC